MRIAAQIKLPGTINKKRRSEIEISGGWRRNTQRKKKKKVIEINGVVGASSGNSLLLGTEADLPARIEDPASDC